MGSDAQNRSYIENEVQLIRDNCSDEVTKAIDLMREMGLRIKGAVNERVEHFVPNERGIGWCLTIEKGTGITKGGRFRQVDVPQRLRTTT